MTPASYDPSVSFQEEATDLVSGRSSVRPEALDGELANISTSVSGVISSLTAIQREDSELRDGIVKPHALSADTLQLIGSAGGSRWNPRGVWVTARAYAVYDLVATTGGSYLCIVAHTSGTFATDLAAGKWQLVAPDVSGVTAANITFTPTGGISAANIQAAIAEVDSEKLAKASNLSDLASASTARGNLVVFSKAEIQNTSGTFAVASGTPDLITATYSPAPAALVDGLRLSFKATGKNTVSNPAFAPNGLASKFIFKNNNEALLVGDICDANCIVTVQFVSAFDGWQLINPAKSGLSNGRLAKTATYTIANADDRKTIALGGTDYYVVSLATASGYDANFQVRILNEDTTRGKRISPLGGTSFMLWPEQTCIVYNQNNTWRVDMAPRFKLGGITTFNVDTVSGMDTSDGLGTGTGAWRTVQHGIDTIVKEIDCNNVQPTIQVLDGSTVVEPVSLFGQPVGSLQIFITGNRTAGSQIPWNTTVDNQTLVQVRDNGILTVRGFHPVSGHTGCTFFNPSQGGVIDYDSINFGQFLGGTHIDIGAGGSCNCLDTSTLTTITGSATYHINMSGAGANHTMGGATIDMPNALAFTSFVRASGPCCVNWSLNAFTGTGSAGGSTGTKYALDGNAVFYAGGTTVPCASAGNATHGGQFI